MKAIVRKMDAAGLGDVKLVLICDSPPVSVERHRPLLHDADLVGRVAAFSHHTYGDGNVGDAGPGWYLGDSPQAELAQALAMSPHRGVGLWMTEYGDLDQTGLVEWGVAWRSTRRLMKFVADGFSAGIAWDAFDNLHEHDGVWALYGLLETDRDDLDPQPQEALLRGEAGLPLRALRLDAGGGERGRLGTRRTSTGSGTTPCARSGCWGSSRLTGATSPSWG